MKPPTRKQIDLLLNLPEPESNQTRYATVGKGEYNDLERLVKRGWAVEVGVRHSPFDERRMYRRTLLGSEMIEKYW